MARKIEPIWIYGPVPVGFWLRSENRRAYFEWLQEKLKITRPEGWYEIRARDLKRFAGGGILAYYPTVLELVTNFIPWHDWKEWLFHKTPEGFWEDPVNQCRYLDWLGEKLGYEEPQDWYQVRTVHFHQNHGERLLRLYGEGAITKLMRLYIPDYDWKDWLFRVTPRSFWDDEENIYRYFDWLGEQMGYEEPEDWYQVRSSDFWSYGGGKLLHKFEASPSVVVAFCLPDHEWFEWLFPSVPHRFWDEPENLRRYFDWLGDQLGFTEPEEWYRIRAVDFADHHGSAVLKRFGGLCDAVRFYLPDYEWHEWLFEKTSRNFWNRRENRHRYLDWLGAQLGYEKAEDWYRISRTLVETHRGGAMLGYYGRFPLTVLQDYMPHNDWEEARFVHLVPERERKWDDPAKRRRFLEELGEKLGFTKMEDWYQITGNLLRENSGSFILSRSGGSPSRVVMEHFPEYDWQEWLFSSIPERFWKEPERICAYFNWLGDRMGVEKPEDWYRIKYSDYQQHGGSKMLDHFLCSPIEIVEFCLPDHEWLEWKFTAVPPGFWDRQENVRRYLEWLGEQLGFEATEDFYRLTGDDFTKNHGASVLVKFGGICNVVRHGFPERVWHEWLFSRATVGFWTRRENRCRYLDWLGKQLGYEAPEDWYRLSWHLVQQYHGGKMARYFRDFPSDVVKECMPDYDWKDWLFRITPKGFWKKRENCRRYLRWLGEKLGLKGPEEWGQIKRSDVEKYRGTGLLKRYGTVEKVLRDVLEDDPVNSE